MNTYLLTVTDLFGGEANFSWVRRYKVTAKSHLGAIQSLPSTQAQAGGDH